MSNLSGDDWLLNVTVSKFFTRTELLYFMLGKERKEKKWLKYVFCQSKHFFYHSIKTNCLKLSYLYFVKRWASLEIPDKDSSKVEWDFFYIFFPREFNKNQRLFWEKANERKWSENKRLWNKKCYTYKHGIAASQTTQIFVLWCLSDN